MQTPLVEVHIRYDTDSTGKLDKAQLKAYMQSQCGAGDPEVTDADVRSERRLRAVRVRRICRG